LSPYKREIRNKSTLVLDFLRMPRQPLPRAYPSVVLSAFYISCAWLHSGAHKPWATYGKKTLATLHRCTNFRIACFLLLIAYLPLLHDYYETCTCVHGGDTCSPNGGGPNRAFFHTPTPFSSLVPFIVSIPCSITAAGFPKVAIAQTFAEIGFRNRSSVLGPLMIRVGNVIGFYPSRPLRLCFSPLPIL